MTKIQGKFYPLQHLEWLRACKELKPAERDILYYIRTLDPHSDGKELSVSAIASDLGRDKGTVSRALQVLLAKGFVEIELVRVKIKILGLGVLCVDNSVVSTQQGCVHTTEVVSTQPPLSTDNLSCPHTTEVVSTQHQKSPEPIPSNASSDLPKTQTYKTYKDFKDSLSEEERESFESFCRNEVAGLPRPVVSLQDYLAAGDASGQPRYLDFYRRFAGTTVAAQIRTQQAADALTEELYQQFDREFRAMDCEYMDFVKDCPHKSPEWELRVKFLEEWDRRNNAVPLL